MRLWIFTTAKVFPHGVTSTFQCFMVFFINYYYYYFTPSEFFTLALADGLSQEFEWQQVSLSVQDFSEF